MKQWIDRLGSPHFGANLDIGHSQVIGESIPDSVRMLSGRIWNMHVEDIPGRSNVGDSQARTRLAVIDVVTGDVKWVDLDPTGAPGVKIADLWGDHTKGAYGAITKFPAGFVAPLHTHTNSMKIVIISGTFISTPAASLATRDSPWADPEAR